MVQTVVIQYPHNIIVIGKTINEHITGEQLRNATPNSFQIWLNRNLISNDNLNLGISLLCKTKEEWQKAAQTYGLRYSYEFYLDRPQLFSGK